MRKGIKYTLVTLGVIVALLAGITAWLVNAGRDTSPPPLTKAPERSVPAGDIGDVNLAPSSWDPQALASLNERNASFGDSDVLARGDNGVIAGTTGAPAVYAGLQALKQGGTAIDALLATSLAQILLAAGSWVSYAGIFNLVYYDSATGEAYNLNASYNSFLNEDDPASIPTEKDSEGNPTPSGRTALVPGYFAGVQAAHDKFGKLPFAALFDPAIHYAEEGFVVSEFHEKAFERRKDVLTRLPETRAIFTKDDGSMYAEGELFRQTALAKTLRAVAEQGADYIYSGPWAERFTQAVQAEGGKVQLEDLTRYKPIWSEPLVLEFGDFQLFMHERPGQGGTHLAESLNLTKVSGLAGMGDYRESPEAFFWYSQFSHVFAISFVPSIMRGALFRGLDTGMAHRSTEAYAEQLWQKMSDGDFMFTTAPTKDPKHSDAIVVIDRWGNMAAVTHTINTAAWGGTGIFVDGISIPDSAAFQQAQLAEIEPGSRLPDPTEPLVILRGGKPFGAFSSIGGGLHQKTFTVLLNILANGASLEEAMSAPSTHLPAFNTEEAMKPPAVQVVDGEFSDELLDSVRGMGLEVKEFGNALEDRAPRGYVVGAVINEDGSREAMGPRLFNAPALGY